MSNRSYNASGAPGFSAVGASVQIRQEFEAIAAGMAELEKEIDQKEFAASGPSEWVNPVREETYISATQFKWNGPDATDVMIPRRRVRCTVNDTYVYSEVMSAVYGSGVTTVNLYDPILTDKLTLVEYATLTPIDHPTASVSLDHLIDIIKGVIEDVVPGLVLSFGPDVIFTDAAGSGEKCKLGVVYTEENEAGEKTFAIVPIPV